MTPVVMPDGWRVALLAKHHPRKRFRSGQVQVDDWLRSKALQHQTKHLSVTKVLLDAAGEIAGYYTLASGQVDFNELPADLAKKLPKRALPVAILAWLGIHSDQQGHGLGARLMALALLDCYAAMKIIPFVAVVLNSVDDGAKRFYRKWDFAELPGHPYRLFISVARLEALVQGSQESSS